MEEPKHILICDDQVIIHETIGVYLKAEGMIYSSVYDGAEILEKFETINPDLIILDLMMPKIFGTEVCKLIRKKSNVPIIILSAKGEEIDRILGLEIGADDYIVKPFSPREVVARIRTIFRRIAPIAEIKEKILRFDQLIIDLEAYEIKINGEAIESTPKEIEIFYLLASNVGKVLDREQILASIWGYDYLGDTRAVDTHIKRLRKKLPIKSVNWEIKAIYGVGYKFEVR